MLATTARRRREGSVGDAERSLDLTDVEELMVGGGQGEGAQRHVQDFAVEFDVCRLSELSFGEIGEQALCVLADGGQRPAQFGERNVGFGVGQSDATDGWYGQLGRHFAAQEHELWLEPALGVDQV